MWVREFHYLALALKPAQIASPLTYSAGYGQKQPDLPHPLSIGETNDGVAEPDHGGHHWRFTEAKSCGIETITCSRRSCSLAKGGQVGSRLCVCNFCFGLTQTPVGEFTRRPVGILIPHPGAPTDSKVVAVTDDGLCSQLPFLLRYCLTHEDL